MPGKKWKTTVSPLAAVVELGEKDRPLLPTSMSIVAAEAQDRRRAVNRTDWTRILNVKLVQKFQLKVGLEIGI